MKTWIKNKLSKWLEVSKLLERTQELEEAEKILQSRLDNLEQLVKDCTNVSADIHYQHQHGSVIFVAGRYRNRDYVKLFNVPHDNMNHLVDILKDMEQTNRRGYYDEPLQMNIKGWIDR